jgi:hypothetical protein
MEYENDTSSVMRKHETRKKKKGTEEHKMKDRT